MNKYKKFAQKAAEEYKKHRACERKVAFKSQEAAMQKGMATYLCPYCDKWHRTSVFRG